MKHANKKIPEYRKELVEIFAKILGNRELMGLFLKDILTPNEFEALSLRWQIVKKLNKGETHRSVVEDLGLGMSTVTRGSRMLRNKNGGFNLVFKKLGQ
ncbi:transcriptional regulator [Candidatus Nomurabacteria bacterium]|nr:transcriptional regulator [Candidatus Nomurabacteria bacterium]